VIAVDQPTLPWVWQAHPLLDFGADADVAAARLAGRVVWVSAPVGRRGPAFDGDAAVGEMMRRGVPAICGAAVASHACACWRARAAQRSSSDRWPWTQGAPHLLGSLRSSCGGVWVPHIDGWDRSPEVAEDVLWALSANVRVMVEAQP